MTDDNLAATVDPLWNRAMYDKAKQRILRRQVISKAADGLTFVQFEDVISPTVFMVLIIVGALAMAAAIGISIRGGNPLPYHNLRELYTYIIQQ